MIDSRTITVSLKQWVNVALQLVDIKVTRVVLVSRGMMVLKLNIFI